VCGVDLQRIRRAERPAEHHHWEERRRYGSAETGLDFAPVNGILVHDGLRKTPNRSRLDDVARRFPLRLNPDVLLQSLNHCAVANLSFVPVEIPNSARTAAL